MPHYQAHHEKVLTLVFEERWLDLTADDHDVLKAFVYTGYIYAIPVKANPGRFGLVLTRQGELYLAHLRHGTLPRYVEPDLPDTALRRATDVTFQCFGC
jgi:hypothetical protein